MLTIQACERWSLQAARRWRELKQPQDAKHGMCMAVALFRQPGRAALYAAVGYEDGTLSVWDTTHPEQALMSVRLHAEPIMTVAIDAQGTGTSQQLSVPLWRHCCWQACTSAACVGLLEI